MPSVGRLCPHKLWGFKLVVLLKSTFLSSATTPSAECFFEALQRGLNMLSSLQLPSHRIPSHPVPSNTIVSQVSSCNRRYSQRTAWCLTSGLLWLVTCSQTLIEWAPSRARFLLFMGRETRLCRSGELTVRDAGGGQGRQARAALVTALITALFVNAKVMYDSLTPTHACALLKGTARSSS